MRAKTWLRGEARRGRRRARAAVLWGLAGTALAVLQAGCVAVLLAEPALPHLLPLLTFAAAALARAGVVVLADRAGFEAGSRARRRLRTDALARILAAGPALLRDDAAGQAAVGQGATGQGATGRWVTTVVDRVEALDGYFGRWLPAASLAVAGPALVVAALLPFDWRAALLLAGAGVLVPLGMALAGIGAATASRQQFEALARLQARFVDRMRGIGTLVLAGRSADEAAALLRAAREFRHRTMRVLRVAFVSSAIMDLLTVAAIVALALRLDPGHPAATLFALLLVPEFFAPFRAFSAAYQDSMAARGAADAFAALPSPARTLTAPALVRTVEASGVTVAFEDVRVSWDPARGPALDGLSFRVTPGETLVLAGPSGSGKSTVMEVLLGFVQPERGRVTINGADLSSLVPQALAGLTAWIGQRPVLFAASLRDNILFGRPDASEAELMEAAAAARVLPFAAGLPHGLDTVLGEGGFGLSGGQVQRIAVARAFLKDAPLLLMDEPTAHLDPATEADLLDSLKRLTLRRTVILATHSAAAQAFGGRRLDLLPNGRTAALGAA